MYLNLTNSNHMAILSIYVKKLIELLDFSEKIFNVIR